MSTQSNEEQAFLAEYDPGEFERPSVSVDVVVLTAIDGDLWVALYKREEHPHRGRFALPGGFVGINEGLEQAARRLLRDKAGLKKVYFEQLRAFGSPKRDPRMRIITIAFFALTSPNVFEAVQKKKGATLSRIKRNGSLNALSSTDTPLKLAFDHDDILNCAVEGLRSKLDHSPVAYQLLPEEFTLRSLQSVHEAIRGKKLNKDSFRRRLLASGELIATGSKEEDTSFRPAELYRFNRGPAV